MFKHDEDPAEPPECAGIQAAASELVSAFVTTLNEMGYDFALVSVRQRIRTSRGITFSPGAIAHRFNPALGPVLRKEAEDLRRVAAELEQYCKDNAVPDVLGGYTQKVDE